MSTKSTRPVSNDTLAGPETTPPARQAASELAPGPETPHNTPPDTLAAHYRSPDLASRILAAFREAGDDPNTLTLTDLARVDQFHSKGLKATLELAEALAPAHGDHVLDIGCGLGGPARWLARTHGCRVTGLDLTPDLAAAARTLTRLTRLDDRVAVTVASAEALPLPDGAVDAAWIQNVAMNVADRPRLYGEIRRVLRPGGRCAFADVVAVPGQEVLYPTPWAPTAAQSHLLTAEDTRGALEHAGVHILTWRDETDSAHLHADRRAAAAPHPVGIDLILGPRWPEIARTMQRNLREGRVRLVMGVWQKPTA